MGRIFAAAARQTVAAMGERHAIVVSPRLPHPPVTGGQKRTLRLLEAMERAGVRPHLVSADDATPAAAAALRDRGWGVEVVASPRPSRRGPGGCSPSTPRSCSSSTRRAPRARSRSVCRWRSASTTSTRSCCGGPPGWPPESTGAALEPRSPYAAPRAERLPPRGPGDLRLGPRRRRGRAGRRAAPARAQRHRRGLLRGTGRARRRAGRLLRRARLRPEPPRARALSRRGMAGGPRAP